MTWIQNDGTEPAPPRPKPPAARRPPAYGTVRAVFLALILAALGGALLARNVAARFPQVYAEAMLVSEDLVGLVTETLETGIWIVFNLITPSA